MSRFEDKFSKLDLETQSEIYEAAKELGAWKTSKDYAEKIGMNQMYLFQKLQKYLKKLHNPEKAESEDTNTGKKIKSEDKSQVRLSKQEKDFLKRIETGSVTLEEASKFVAMKVFKKMLENPQDARFIDFFRVELLKIKQTEVQDRNNWAMTLINKIFSGNPPPRFCPKCGEEIVKITAPVHAIEGEVLGGEGG